MASILYEVAEGKASQKQKNILLYRTIKKDWADGFAAPDGQRFALTTRRLDNAARYPQFHSPNSKEGMLFLTGMKEKCREACSHAAKPYPDWDNVGKSSWL